MSASAFFSSKTFSVLCSYILIGNRVRVKILGMAPVLANAWPLGSVKFQMPHPRDWQGVQMPRSNRGGGGWAQVELIDALRLI